MNLHAQSVLFLADLLEEEATKREKLELAIDHLLNNSIYRLRWILYKIDVDEEKVTSILRTKQPDVAKQITDLLLQRCYKILETRRNYQSDSSIFDTI